VISFEGCGFFFFIQVTIYLIYNSPVLGLMEEGDWRWVVRLCFHVSFWDCLAWFHRFIVIFGELGVMLIWSH
jgi:hypothetical protein